MRASSPTKAPVISGTVGNMLSVNVDIWDASPGYYTFVWQHGTTGAERGSGPTYMPDH